MESMLIKWIVTIQVRIENRDWESLSGGTNYRVEEFDGFDKGECIFVQDSNPIRVGAKRIDTLMKLPQPSGPSRLLGGEDADPSRL